MSSSGPPEVGAARTSWGSQAMRRPEAPGLSLTGGGAPESTALPFQREIEEREVQGSCFSKRRSAERELVLISVVPFVKGDEHSSDPCLEWDFLLEHPEMQGCPEGPVLAVAVGAAGCLPQTLPTLWPCKTPRIV